MVTMSKKKDLRNIVKQRIFEILADGGIIHDVATLLHRDVRTIRKYETDVHGTCEKRSDAGSRKITQRELRKVTTALRKNSFVKQQNDL